MTCLRKHREKAKPSISKSLSSLDRRTPATRRRRVRLHKSWDVNSDGASQAEALARV